MSQPPSSAWQPPSGRPPPQDDQRAGPAGWGQVPPPGTTPGPAVPGDPAPAGPPGWRPPPKPGVVPLRPLGLGDLLDGAVQTMRQNPRVMLGVSAAVMAVSAVLSTTLIIVGLPPMTAGFESADADLSADQVAAVLGGGVLSLLLPAVVQGLATIVLTGILIAAVSQAVLGRRPSVAEVWRRARPRVPALVGLSVLSALVVVVVMAVLLVPGVLLLVAGQGVAGGAALALGVIVALVVAVLVYVRLAFAAPALLLERLGVVTALRRSWRLVAGSWWRCFGVLLLGAIIAGAINGLVQLPFSLLGSLVGGLVGGDPSTGEVTVGLQLSLIVGNIGGVLASTVTAPFTAALTALLYIDLRVRREGLDVALARASAQER